MSERQMDASWKLLTRFRPLKANLGMTPYMDNQDRIWFCEPLHDQIAFQYFSDATWTSGLIQLEQSLDSTLQGCHCNINDEGRLEILVYRGGIDGMMAVVETVTPVISTESE